MPSSNWSRTLLLQFTKCIILMVLFSSCLKQNMDLPHDRTMLISFNQQTIPFADTDSALVIFTKQGSPTALIKSLRKMTGSFKLELDDLNSGSWKAEVLLYTKKDMQGISNQYITSLQFTADQISGIYLTGPSPTNTQWKKNIVLSTPNNDIVVIIPQDVVYPEFEIRSTSQQWNSFKVERGAFLRSGSMNLQVAAASWECQVNCMNSDRLIRNNTAFAAFSNEMKSKTWNNGEVSIIIEDSNLQIRKEFYYNWNK